MQRRYLPLLGLALFIGFAFLANTARVQAAPAAQTGPSQPTPDPLLSISNETCLACHGQPGAPYILEYGDLLDLYVPAEEYNASVHGRLGYGCVQCHRTVGVYPHPPFEAIDLRDATIQLNETCERCHQHQFELAQDSAHAAAQAAGLREAAVCTDCHSAHAVRRLTDPVTHKFLPDARVWVAATCAKCHSPIYEKYKESVHGSALIDQGNLDVPTCIDCHGVHNIEDPRTARFRLASPQMCARCHTDKTIMAKYGISTEVLNTYVADFHGTTVTLFEKTSPDAETNKPVCYDCHGIHDIARAADPQKGLLVRENLLARCQVCHPDATSNFPEAWMSHYIPSPDKNPIVYYVNLFYKFLIPIVLGGMAVLVALDLNKSYTGRLLKRARKSVLKSSSTAQPPSETATSEEALVPPPTPPSGETSIEDTTQPPPPPSEEANREDVTETPPPAPDEPAEDDAPGGQS